jgi:hypothetical protein
MAHGARVIHNGQVLVVSHISTTATNGKPGYYHVSVTYMDEAKYMEAWIKQQQWFEDLNRVAAPGRPGVESE